MKTEIVVGGCIKRSSEWEKNGKILDERNWRLLTENIVREK